MSDLSTLSIQLDSSKVQEATAALNELAAAALRAQEALTALGTALPGKISLQVDRNIAIAQSPIINR